VTPTTARLLQAGQVQVGAHQLQLGTRPCTSLKAPLPRLHHHSLLRILPEIKGGAAGPLAFC
jgi:hypothetical protein